MNTFKITTRAGLVITAILLLGGCAGLLDGPFNQNGEMVPGLLYANNDTDCVTYWDDATNSYRTYNQSKNIYLNTVAFNPDDIETNDRDRTPGNRRSQNFLIASNVVMPLTHLNPQEMDIQLNQGCIACHTN